MDKLISSLRIKGIESVEIVIQILQMSSELEYDNLKQQCSGIYLSLNSLGESVPLFFTYSPET